MTPMTDSTRSRRGDADARSAQTAQEEYVPPPPARSTGARLREQLADDVWLEELIDRASEGGVQLTGPGGFLPELIKAVLERGLAAELTDHLGYEHGQRVGAVNSRNGATPKTVASEVGDVALDVPRDRDATFAPRLVAKGQRRLGGLDEMIISLFAGGMTVRDIPASPGRHPGHRAVPRDDRQRHRRGAGGGQGVADPAAGGLLPDRVPRRAGGEGPRRRPRA